MTLDRENVLPQIFKIIENVTINRTAREVT
jgi:hypothetical protein